MDHGRKEGLTVTYGLWPQSHSLIDRDTLGQRQGWNASGTHIRSGLEAGFFEPACSRFYSLTADQQEKLASALDRPSLWSERNNCSAWATRTVQEVTGEKLVARDPLAGFLVQTPSSLGDTLQRLERLNATSPEAPAVRPMTTADMRATKLADGPDRSSTRSAVGHSSAAELTQPDLENDREHER